MQKKFCILGRDFYPYQFSLLNLCEDLHMFHTGSLEIYEAAPIYIAVKYIRDSLKNWRKTPVSRWAAYDEAVRMLCTVAINEVTARPDWGDIVKCAVQELRDGKVDWEYFENVCACVVEVKCKEEMKNV